MINLPDYFDPSIVESLSVSGRDSGGYIKNSIINGCSYSGSWDEVDIAIIGISDGCNSNGNSGCGLAPDIIRRELYKLAGFESFVIADLGNVKGTNVRNKIFALSEVIPFLVDAGTVIVVLGGSNDYLHPLAKILAGTKKINIAIADSSIDYSPSVDDYTSDNYIGAMAAELKDNIQQCFLIGTQRYLTSRSVENSLNYNIFENIRLGNIRGDQFKSIEPLIRDSNIMAIDASVVRSQDMPAQKGAMPNGFFAHELCQLTWYAGMSDNMKIVGFFEMNPENDSREGLGAMLMAQAVWHFIDGNAHRYYDYPFCSIDYYDSYLVWMENLDIEIKFYRNAMNNRWWVEIPTDDGREIISCTEEDYKIAMENEIPERWFKMIVKKD